MCCCDYDPSDELREDAERAREQANRALRAATAAERDAGDARAERDATHRQYLVIRDELEDVRVQRDTLLTVIRQVDALHYQADDDPGGPPYCPECVAYDGNPNPCPTSDLTRAALDTTEHRTGD